ncbi:hypothetical protein BZJ19_10000 [Salinivibrio proteolyticus]|uniref:phage major tail tube protein n=1 Tax=Salinivibrio proteolyticus TaxID=334715 RepID=UPI0009896708|nr:phage major tail tube protein [Salinivibrio proteolyticus]OOF25044.1 hypothetical protein BZJ19_10000 [Salinivibrio proteolyticus]
MADRIRMRLTAQVESVPMMNEIVDFTPPELKAKLASNEGSFVQHEDTVGLEKLSWTLKVRGEHGAIQKELGKFLMNNAQINITEKGRTTDGEPYSVEYSLYGGITNIKKEAVKMGEKPEVSIEGTCRAYKETDTDTVVHDINVDTGKTIIGTVDMMQEAGIQ